MFQNIDFNDYIIRILVTRQHTNIYIIKEAKVVYAFYRTTYQEFIERFTFLLNEFTSNNFIACFLVTSRNDILYNAFYDMNMKHTLVIYTNTVNVGQHIAITSICCINTLNFLAYIYGVKNLTWL